jgi:hypothetical protein
VSFQSVAVFSVISFFGLGLGPGLSDLMQTVF